MKPNCFVFLVLFIFAFTASAWAQCPEDTVDLGDCDTLHLIALDTLCCSFPCEVEVVILITHDANEIPMWDEDSIMAFVVPLTWATDNPSAYCSVSTYWNTSATYYFDPNFKRSVFRHIVEGTDTLYHNRIAEMVNDSLFAPWTMVLRMNSDTTDTVIFGEHVIRPYFHLYLAPSVPDIWAWWEGKRVLLATFTFKVEDEMSICIDSVFWPPNSWLLFDRIDSKNYVPRDNMPYCISISYPSVGDLNADGQIDIGDVVYLIDYLFREGSDPCSLHVGDVTCDGEVTIDDVVYLISYLFRGGPEPSC